jgi:hypothetical protein
MINLPQLQLSQSSTIMDAQAFVYLTPDALMGYCESRLQGIDTQVQEAFAKQEMGNADATQLSNLAGLDALSAPKDNLDLSTLDGFQKAWDAYKAIQATAQSIQDPATKQAVNNVAYQLQKTLTSALDDMLNPKTGDPSQFKDDADVQNFFGGKFNSVGIKTGGTSQSIDTAGWQSLVTDAVKNVQQDLNSNSELSMINLQSLMSQRQEAIQVCTNLVQSMGDQCDKIAENVGK